MCPHTNGIAGAVESKKKEGNTKGALEQEETYEKSKTKGVLSGGYLIGRHPECGKYIPAATRALVGEAV